MTQQESPTENSFHNNDNNNMVTRPESVSIKRDRDRETKTERQRQRDKDRDRKYMYVQCTIARKIEFDGNKSNLKQFNPAIKRAKKAKT